MTTTIKLKLTDGELAFLRSAFAMLVDPDDVDFDLSNSIWGQITKELERTGKINVELPERTL